LFRTNTGHRQGELFSDFQRFNPVVAKRLKNSWAMRFYEQANYDESNEHFKAKASKKVTSDSLQSAYDTDAAYRDKGVVVPKSKLIRQKMLIIVLDSG